MRLLSAAAVLCFTASLILPAAAAKHHHRHAGHRASAPSIVPLPPERPDITDDFGIVKRSSRGIRGLGPDGLETKPGK